MKASETESATQRKQPVEAEEEPSQEQLREEFRADDKGEAIHPFFTLDVFLYFFQPLIFT